MMVAPTVELVQPVRLGVPVDLFFVLAVFGILMSLALLGQHRT